MSRNLDASMKAALGGGLIQPVILAELVFKSETLYVWSGVGDFVFNGNTYTGVGMLGSISPVVEGVDVRADGLTLQLAGMPLVDSSIANPGIATAAAVPGTAAPWATTGGQNAAYAFGQNDGTAPVVARAVSPGQVLMITATGAVRYDPGPLGLGPSFSPDGDPGFISGSGTFDGFLFPTCYMAPGRSLGVGALCGAFTDLFGNVVQAVSIGSGAVARVPAGAAQLQLGINDMHFVDNDGSFSARITELTNGTPLYDVLTDVQLGAPAKIWFGLMANGSLIGSPYLIFSGLVDQPSLEVDAQTLTISLALESRMSDLARPSGRRYTAADQRLRYPDDTGFNWVETLNDIALRWGS